MHDVFFYETFQEEEQAIQNQVPSDIQWGYTAQTIQESGHSQPPAPIISLRTQSTIPPAWSNNLQAILSRSAGYDHLAAYRHTTKCRFPLGYLPQYCARAVAEQALMLWMALLRKLPRQTAQFSTFHREGITGRECRGKTLVVVGVGNIGHHICEIGHAMDMNVLGVDLEKKYDDISYLSIEEGLAQADILVSAMNLTPDNVNYFNKNRMKQLKSGALFINIARGELAFAQDLLHLLDSHVVGGLGIDVYNEESSLSVALRNEKIPMPDNPEIQAIQEMSKRDNVILTPHNAFNTIEAVVRKAEQSVEQLIHLKNTGEFLWPVPSL